MPERPRIEIKPFDALTLRELHACLMLRGEVFVVGQRICAVPDVDVHDPEAYHAMLRLGGELIGTARLLPLDIGPVVKVGRVAIAPTQRGRGLGRTLMRAVNRWIDGWPDHSGVMHAQADLQNWYASLGWVRVGDPFMEAEIEHVEMRYTPPSPDS
ncbi:MAG: GNAT family N-acetyltransferase [Phycisphaeraceae bacterium]